MNKLWIFGDSFSSQVDQDDNNEVWFKSLSNKLNYELKNISLIGCAQDWQFLMIDVNKDNISSSDQIILVLTSPSRYWFFDEYPYMTNSHIIDFEKIVGLSRATAAKNYFQYIQRPTLDILHVQLRLGWLNNCVSFYKWKKPIILLGFPQQINDIAQFDNLMFSNGELTNNISDKEHIFSLWNDFHKRTELLKASDPRYNHMCLMNHEVLADKLYDSIVNHNQLDLSDGFHQQILTYNSIKDKEFSAKELCPQYLKEHVEIKTKTFTSWIK